MKGKIVFFSLIASLAVLFMSVSCGPVFSSTGNDYISTNIGTLKYVPSGTFQRNGTSGNNSTVSSFRIGQNDITRVQFSNVMGFDPGYVICSLSPDDPVEASWYHALVFCNKLSKLEGLTPVYSVKGSTDPADWGDVPRSKDADWNNVTADWSANGYRLPTEMEWMWAAMGADTSDPGQINKSGYSKAFAGSTGLNRIDDYAWTDNNANKKTHPPIGTTHPVGTKLPNELGLYDMSGNVWQWCWDWAKDRPSGLLTDFRGSSSGSSRRVRGSNFFYAASAASLTYSDECEPWIVEDLCIGFRVVRN